MNWPASRGRRVRGPASKERNERGAARLPGDPVRQARGDEPGGEGGPRGREGPRQDPRGPHEVPDRREAHQGGDRLLHRPRGPPAHARLRQEVPAQVGGQPDLRRLLDPRLLAPGGVGPAAPGRLAGLLLAARRRLRAGQGAGLRRGLRAGRHALRRGPARAAQGLRRRAAQEGHGRARRERDRGLHLQGPGRRAALLRDRAVRVRLDRRLLPLPAGRHAASLHRHLGRGAARDGLREREGPPRGRAFAVRDELRLLRGPGRSRPGPALQADLRARSRRRWT